MQRFAQKPLWQSLAEDGVDLILNASKAELAPILQDQLPAWTDLREGK